MKLQDLGEFNLIERIRHRFVHTPKGTLGIGDDCAVIPLSENRMQLVTTDLLIENIHFLCDRIAPEDLGHKSLAVNISDIAAMGGTPTGAFLSIALPGGLETSWCDAFFEGIYTLATECNCPLLGGDTTKTKKDIAINFTVLGEMDAAHVKYRSGAMAGDIIATTGVVGDSGGGLRLILGDDPLTSDAHVSLLQAHHHPIPHLQEGAWLAQHTTVHSMIDVSDGIDSDICHIMKASSVGANIDLAQIPISKELRLVGEKSQWPIEELALTGGEDYVLLCTVDPIAFAQLANAFEQHFQRPLYPIGHITNTHQLNYERAGIAHNLQSIGFDHFKTP